MTHKRTTPKIFFRAKELRKVQTPTEQKLWAHLRNHRLNGLGFRRQHALGPFIVDFCCPMYKGIVEVDGSQHLEQNEYDEARTKWLNDHGWKVIRFTNQEVEQDIDAVLMVILETFTPSQPPPSENLQIGEEKTSSHPNKN